MTSIAITLRINNVTAKSDEGYVLATCILQNSSRLRDRESLLDFAILVRGALRSNLWSDENCSYCARQYERQQTEQANLHKTTLQSGIESTALGSDRR
jgi:hypothetical protein